MRKAYKNAGRMQVLFTVLFVFAAFAGSYNTYSQNAFRKNYESKLRDNEKCLVQGKIYKKEQDSENYLYYLKDCVMQLHQKNYSCNRILVYLDADRYSIGEIICVKGNIKTFSLPRNEGNYNERQYYQSLKIDFKVEGKKVFGVYGKKDSFREGLYFLKEKMKESFCNTMSEQDAGVLTAMILGDKSLMDAERKSMYQDAGISHFYSISGLHISMLGMALYQFLRKRGGSYLISGAVGAVLILTYGELIGYGISASRAIGMFLILLYAKYRGRSYDRATALALMAAILAGENPGILHQAGFFLSFGAVAGVIFAEQLLKEEKTENEEKNQKIQNVDKIKKKAGDAIKEWGRSTIKSVKETFVVSLCIQVVTIPIMCQFFYEISVYTVFVNLVILPCMGALLGIGILGGVLGCFLPVLAKYLLIPCCLILQIFEIVCQSFLKLPYASCITGELSEGKILLWYGMVAGFLLLKKYGKGRKLFVLILPLCFLLLLQSTPSFEIDFLDVGQGDGVYITTGDGTNLFIDGGSSSVSKVGIYRILPFLKKRGVKRIDYWFVSHCDNDHISGLLEVLEENYEIKTLVVSEKIPKDEAWQELQNLAVAKQISIMKMKEGDVLKGRKENGDENWSIRCLFPNKSYKTQDRNALSLTLLFEKESFTGLFAGDISEEEEKILLKNKSLQKIDVYKVSHHGSKYSNSKELLEVIKPDITVISCGLYNSYGHPHAEAVRRLEDVGSEMFYTMKSGEILIQIEKGATSISEYRK